MLHKIQKWGFGLILLFVFLGFYGPGCGHAADEATLHDAILERDYQTVKRLVDQGANVNEKDATGKPAFALALLNDCQTGGTEMSEMFLAHGANVNLVMGEGKESISPLGFAMLCKNDNLIRLLVARGAGANGRIDLGSGEFSLLAYAEATNQAWLVRLLLKKGASKAGMEKEIPIVRAYLKWQASFNDRMHLAQLKSTLKNLFLASQAYLTDYPGQTVTSMEQLKDKVPLTDQEEFVSADLSDKGGRIVVRHKALDSGNSIPVKGLKPGEGMVTHEGVVVTPELK